MVKTTSQKWVGHVLRKEDDEPKRRAWNLDKNGTRGKESSKFTWRDVVEKKISEIDWLV